jgi:retron-type reverse transcriptase
MEQGLRWVVDVDISKYFDTIDHAHLRQFLDQRVTDGVVRKMIDKWLKAGVLEEGVLRRTTGGTPQGGVISPLLANIYLHYVLDEWFEKGWGGRIRTSHGGINIPATLSRSKAKINEPFAFASWWESRQARVRRRATIPERCFLPDGLQQGRLNRVVVGR